MASGVADSNGFGWSILKSLYGAGATVVVGSWAPMALRFEKMLSSGALDHDRIIDDFKGGTTGNEKKRMLEIKKVYPLDVSYDGPEDVPEDVSGRHSRYRQWCWHTWSPVSVHFIILHQISVVVFCLQVKASRRFSSFQGFSISEVAKQVAADFGRVDILVHAIANGPEVRLPICHACLYVVRVSIPPVSNNSVFFYLICLPCCLTGFEAIATNISQRLLVGSFFFSILVCVDGPTLRPLYAHWRSRVVTHLYSQWKGHPRYVQPPNNYYLISHWLHH